MLKKGRHHKLKTTWLNLLNQKEMLTNHTTHKKHTTAQATETTIINSTWLIIGEIFVGRRFPLYGGPTEFGKVWTPVSNFLEL